MAISHLTLWQFNVRGSHLTHIVGTEAGALEFHEQLFSLFSIIHKPRDGGSFLRVFFGWRMGVVGQCDPGGCWAPNAPTTIGPIRGSRFKRTPFCASACRRLGRCALLDDLLLYKYDAFATYLLLGITSSLNKSLLLS